MLSFKIPSSMNELTACLSNELLHDSALMRIFSSVDRKYFIPNSYLENPLDVYMDAPHYIGFNATISAPHMACTDTLSQMHGPLSRPNCKALDIGSGSGLLTLLMAKINKNGRTIGIDHIPELVSQSISNVAESGHKALLDGNVLEFLVADGRDGYAMESPYDVIHIGAGVSELPGKIVSQLKPNGILVAPIGPEGHQIFQVITKISQQKVTTKTITAVRYIPLTSANGQLANR
ncbi:hypothetical protein MDAP_002783 [Mitosporidium daphniae]